MSGEPFVWSDPEKKLIAMRAEVELRFGQKTNSTEAYVNWVSSLQEEDRMVAMFHVHMLSEGKIAPIVSDEVWEKCESGEIASGMSEQERKRLVEDPDLQELWRLFSVARDFEGG